MSIIERLELFRQAGKDAKKSKIAHVKYPLGSSKGEIYRRNFDIVPIPQRFLDLTNVDNADLKHFNIDPEVFDSWAMDLANYRIPPGFETLQEFYDYFSSLFPDPVPPEVPYYKAVYERGRSGK